MMQKTNKESNICILLSGGIDSSACIAFYIEEGFSISGIFIDYGQPAVQKEEEASAIIAKYYGINLKKVKYTGFQNKNDGFIKGRNAFLFIAALMELPDEVSVLAAGIHSGTNYADCTPFFVSKMQSLFDMYTEGGLQLDMPFLKWNKRDIWDFCKSRKVPVELTYSCEKGLSQPCGKCLSCYDLEELYACTQK